MSEETQPMTLRQAVTGMLIDMSEGDRNRVAAALAQAQADPQAFVSYTIMQLGNLRAELDSLLVALDAGDVITIVEEPDVTPSA